MTANAAPTRCFIDCFYEPFRHPLRHFGKKRRYLDEVVIRPSSTIRPSVGIFAHAAYVSQPRFDAYCRSSGTKSSNISRKIVAPEAKDSDETTSGVCRFDEGRSLTIAKIISSFCGVDGLGAVGHGKKRSRGPSRSPLPRTLPRKANDKAAFRRPVISYSNTKKIWSGRRGSNPRPRPWQGRAPVRLSDREAAFAFMACCAKTGIPYREG